MERLKITRRDNSTGSVLIDVLIAMIIMSISLVVVLGGISSIGKQASVNREKAIQLIELRNSMETDKKSEFYYKEK
ncbi:MAG TPA: hypothetical protein ENI15_14040 [Spirochaetes bacterium]|nr:hypothetical protein [Spirochaetota bacterium]